MNLEELRSKLNEEPKAEEISFLPDGARYLSIDVVRKKADEIFDKWEHSDFVLSTFAFGKETFASGSINLKLLFRSEEIDKHVYIYHSERNISGAATIKISEYQNNPHFAATLKSLCIVNALSNEYVCFGKNLNAGLYSEMPEVEPKGKYLPDVLIVQKLKMAIENSDFKAMHELTNDYNFQYAEPALLEKALTILKENQPY